MLERVCSCPVVVVDEVMASLADGQQVPVRSGRVRWLLQAGRVREAGALLGRAPMLDGQVVQGAQRGRDLGWPTANLDCSGLLVPMDGVYAGVGVTPDGRRYRAGVSIGTNPTFGEGGRTVEAHLLDFDGPVGMYDWPLQLELHAFVREQITCSDVDELCALISRDLRAVRATVSAGDYAFAP